MRRPGIECGPLLSSPCMALVDADYAAAAAGHMVQHGLRHFQPHALALQAGGHGPPQVVQDPRGQGRDEGARAD
jgi:hypothetical protein